MSLVGPNRSIADVRFSAAHEGKADIEMRLMPHFMSSRPSYAPQALYTSCSIMRGK
jgi:hypothetical protein